MSSASRNDASTAFGSPEVLPDRHTLARRHRGIHLAREHRRPRRRDSGRVRLATRLHLIKQRQQFVSPLHRRDVPRSIRSETRTGRELAANLPPREFSRHAAHKRTIRRRGHRNIGASRRHTPIWSDGKPCPGRQRSTRERTRWSRHARRWTCPSGTEGYLRHAGSGIGHGLGISDSLDTTRRGRDVRSALQRIDGTRATSHTAHDTSQRPEARRGQHHITRRQEASGTFPRARRESFHAGAEWASVE